MIDLDQEKQQAGLPLLVPADGACDGSKLDILVDSRPAADCRSAIFILAGRSMSHGRNIAGEYRRVESRYSRAA